MTRHLSAALALVLTCATTSWAQPAPAVPATRPATAPAARHQPDVAAPKMVRGGSDIDPRFLERHERYKARAAQGGVDVLFVGDSITQAWGGKENQAIFDEHFGDRAAHFGIGGDQTQHVLWRLEDGELDGITPKVVVLMIGTNNTGGHAADQIAAGIKAIVKSIHRHSPTSKVLLLGIFPRGENPSDPAVAARREKIAQVNASIATLDDGGKTVRYLDIGEKFLAPDGTISKEIMHDFLHLTSKGYGIWAAAVAPVIAEMAK